MVIDPIKNEMDTMKYNGEVFERKVLEMGKNKKVAYISLLEGDKNYSLYKQYKMKVNSATTPTGYSEAKPAEFNSTTPWYYISNGEEIVPVKGTKSIAEIFNVEIKAVKSYIKKNNCKLSKENDLIEIVQHFQSL